MEARAEVPDVVLEVLALDRRGVLLEGLLADLHVVGPVLRKTVRGRFHNLILHFFCLFRWKKANNFPDN